MNWCILFVVTDDDGMIPCVCSDISQWWDECWYKMKREKKQSVSLCWIGIVWKIMRVDGAIAILIIIFIYTLNDIKHTLLFSNMIWIL